MHDEELLFQEHILSENGSGSATSQENGQSGKQIHQQYNHIFRGQAACAACAALDSEARVSDCRCGTPQLRIRHVQAEEGLARGNCWPSVGGQLAMNWPEEGGDDSGHKRAAGITGFLRPRYASSLNGPWSQGPEWCRWRGSNPHILTDTRF